MVNKLTDMDHITVTNSRCSCTLIHHHSLMRRKETGTERKLRLGTCPHFHIKRNLTNSSRIIKKRIRNKKLRECKTVLEDMEKEIDNYNHHNH
jgi:hypothetical protein